MSDEITLVVPAQEEFHHVAHLVVGGLAARIELGYEDIDDLQTALEAVLARRDDDGDVEIRVAVGEDAVRSTIGPFPGSELDELESDRPTLGLRRVLETVTDGFEVERRGGEAWVVLTKRTRAAAGTAG